MSQVEYTVSQFQSEWFAMECDTTLTLQIIETPHIVVACEVVHLNTQISQFAYLAKKTREATWHDSAVLEPKVEHVAQQEQSSTIGLDAIEEAAELTLALERVAATSQMGVTDKIG